MSKTEILRVLITEKLTTAVREILAVVETTVSGYEDEILFLKRELNHNKNLLDTALQPQIHLRRIDDVGTTDLTPLHSTDEADLSHEQKNRVNSVCSASETCQEENGVDDLATAAPLEETPLEHEESEPSVTDLPDDSTTLCSSDREKGFGEDSINEQSTRMKRIKRLPARYRAFVTSSDGEKSDTEKNNEEKPSKNKKPRTSHLQRNRLVTLGVGLLKNSPGIDPSNNGITNKDDFSLERPVQTILCQQKLSKSDFLKQLRSTFPELGENEPFDVFLTSSANTSAPSKMTQNELYKMFKSLKQDRCDFYLQRKESGTCGKLKNTPFLLVEKPSSNVFEEETPLEKEGNIDLINETVSAAHSAPQTAAGEEQSDDDGDCDDDEPGQSNEHKRPSSPEFKKIIRNTGTGEQNCQVCGCLFRSETILTRHALSHLDNPKCMCGVCGQQLDSSQELENHLGTHRKLFKCDICAQYFLCSQAFQRHIAAHGDEKPFKCHICPKVFASDKWLKIHQVTHKTTYKCDFCPQSYGGLSLLKIHLQKHTGEKPYCCDICGKFLTNYRGLSRHKQTHSGGKSYSCQTCGKKFSSLVYLKTHAKIHTVREKKYLCDICSKTFHTKNILSMHQAVHDQTHIVKCPLCDKLLKRKSYLKTHMRIHKEDRPYVCSQCGKTFKFNAHLKDHMTCHLTIKPLTCSVCGYKCTRKHYLVSHMRTHTGHKPFKCTLCDKAFTQSHCLKTHMKSHQA